MPIQVQEMKYDEHIFDKLRYGGYSRIYQRSSEALLQKKPRSSTKPGIIVFAKDLQSAKTFQ